MSEMPVNFFGFDGVDAHDYPMHSRAAQQLAIDMIYRCLKCDLITFVPGDWLQEQGFSSIESFVEELARVDQYKKFSSDSPGRKKHNLDMGIWLEPQICCTKKGEALIAEHFPSNIGLQKEDALANFNNEVSTIFLECGVPWDAGVLIPIKY